MYKPLPSELTIKPSSIEGLGLFATENIVRKTKLGVCHITDGEEIIRTPLGGFINHSDDSNCELIEVHGQYFLHTKRDISRYEELTLTYKFYSIIQNSYLAYV